MHKAQTVGSWPFDQHVVHKIVAAAAFFVVFFPVSADSDHFERVFGQRDDVWALDAGQIAVFVPVFKAFEVQIDQLLEQKHLADVVGGLNASDFVDRFLDLARIGRRGVRVQENIEVFAGQSALFVLVGVHRNAVREPWALGHDAGAVVGDVNVVCQAQFGHHAAQLVVVIDFLEGRTTVASVEKLLIELRCVLFHHRGDLVVHEILHATGLLELFHRLFAHDLAANRATSGHELLEGLCLELNDGLGQHWMGRA